MSYQNVFKRYELKYLITQSQKQELITLMKEYMEPDKFGNSVISNIYYDTPDKRFIRNSIEKPTYKEKLRVRSYGTPNPDSSVYIELKKKFKGVVYKRRFQLEENLVSPYLDNRVPLQESTQISREIDYLLKLHENLQPSVFISYSREAFYSSTDKNFRVTFDQNIIFRDYDLSLTSGVYGENILSNDLVVLEVKTVYGMPQWLLNFLTEHALYKTSFSKYGYAYENYILPGYKRSTTSREAVLKNQPTKGGKTNVA